MVLPATDGVLLHICACDVVHIPATAPAARAHVTNMVHLPAAPLKVSYTSLIPYLKRCLLPLADGGLVADIELFAVASYPLM